MNYNWEIKNAELGSNLTAKPYKAFLNRLENLDLTISDLKEYTMIGYLDGRSGKENWLSDEMREFWKTSRKIDENEKNCICGRSILHKYYVAEIGNMFKPALVVGSDCMENWGFKVNCLKCAKYSLFSELKGGICKDCRKNDAPTIRGNDAEASRCRSCKTKCSSFKFPDHSTCWICCQAKSICYRCGTKVNLSPKGTPWAYCWNCRK